MTLQSHTPQISFNDMDEVFKMRAARVEYFKVIA